MRRNSLAFRLFLSASTWIIIILVVAGIGLSSLYRHAVERSFDSRLGVYLRALVAAVAAPEEASDRETLALGEPLFDLPLSGWYWQITRLNAQKPDVRVSRSLWDSTLPHLEDRGVKAAADGTRRSYVEGPEDQRLRLVERTVDLGEEGRYLVSVAGDPSEIDEETGAFDQTLMLTFGMLAAVLLLTTMFQVRFGLAPLKRLSERLAAIRAGRADRLEGNFPVEIEPLARETNALIEANRLVVERARTHVGNLAHALKTPLSVVLNETGAQPDNPVAAKVREQADIMRHQINRHLERARIAARLTTVGHVTEVAPVLRTLARMMEKLHHDRGIQIDVDVPDTLRFFGERQDLEEMIGNLIDNACKWARSRVALEAMAEPSAVKGARPALRIIVDDDGPGVSATQREQAAQRGNRLDESKPGSGLGLSIVTELTTLYGGRLELGTAPIGGLRAELILPAVG